MSPNQSKASTPVSSPDDKNWRLLHRNPVFLPAPARSAGRKYKPGLVQPRTDLGRTPALVLPDKIGISLPDISRQIQSRHKSIPKILAQVLFAACRTEMCPCRRAV